jgi:large subunit ribosomal protein L1
MSKHKNARKQKEVRSLVDSDKRYQVDEAIELLKKCHTVKFDQSVDVAVRLGVEPKHADQMVRGAVVLPHGTGKSVRVLVFAKGDKVAEARDAGADHVGGDDLVEKIKGGWLEFDKVCATPDMMGAVGKIGRILGPRGMMPNPRTGTVTFEVGKAVEALKGGKIDFRVEKAGILHAPIGRISFDNDKLAENFRTLMEQVMRLKPASAKGTYLRSVTLAGTMTPGVRLETNSLLRTLK